MFDFSAAEAEVTSLCQQLIRIDTQNWGGNKANPERPAAELIESLFAEVGLRSAIVESAPGRASLVTRISGVDSTAPALVVHGHTDVVPAQAEDWSVDPFAGVIKDGLLWGRGAVDMKDMDAMIIASIRDMVRQGLSPRRDLIVAFFADEEAGGEYGARYVVRNHPEFFSGATEAISEVGGYSVDVRGQRVYLIQTAEKGLAWLNLIAHGSAGHGSQRNDDNPVTRLAAAITRIGEHEWPQEIPTATRQLLTGVAEMTGIPFTAETIGELLAELGSVEKFVAPTLQNTSNPTYLKAGYKHNVIPGTATGYVDCRTLPGQHEDVMLKIKELAASGSTSRSMRRVRPSNRPSRSRSWHRCRQACARPIPRLRCCRTRSPAGRTTSRCPSSASQATASHRSDSPVFSTSRRCSTASTNGCRSTPSPSEPASSATS